MILWCAGLFYQTGAQNLVRMESINYQTKFQQIVFNN